MTRPKLNVAVEEAPRSNYFTSHDPIPCIKSGCTLLDCILGGGWAQGRIVNVVGDKSTGKTLLAIEAVANFVLGGGKYVRYREVESAFDVDYARHLGLPVESVDFGKDPCFTVEDFFKDLTAFIEKDVPEGSKGLYVLDSLDALSDDKEIESDVGAGTYGMGKAKMMSQLFRRLIQKIQNKNVTVFIISQVRENIGVTFGRTTTRSGGRALDFYSSQVVYLASMGVITREKRGIKRPIGVNIKAKCDKNKVSLPFRECIFPILFSYGVDDLPACVDFLVAADRIDLLDVSTKDDAKAKNEYLKRVNALDDVEYARECRRLGKKVRNAWNEIETSFLPERSKYNGSERKAEGG